METCCQTRAKILEAQARLMRMAQSVKIRFRCAACGREHRLEFSFITIERP